MDPMWNNYDELSGQFWQALGQNPELSPLMEVA